MKCIYFILFICFSFSINASSDLSKDMLTIENSTPNTFEINYYMPISSAPEKVLDICFSYSHIKNYINDLVKMIIINDNGDSYTVQYQFKFLLYLNNTTYEKYYDRQENKVSFILKSFSQNLHIIPNLIASYGYYDIIKNNNHLTLHYYESMTIDKEIKPKDLAFSKMQITSYFKNMKKYINKALSVL